MGVIIKLDLRRLWPACTINCWRCSIVSLSYQELFYFLLLFSDSVLGILVCTALSVGLVDKWTSAKPESSTRASTAGKKNGQHANKKGKDVHNSEQVHIDPEGCLEIKEGLEVSVLNYRHVFGYSASIKMIKQGVEGG